MLLQELEAVWSPWRQLDRLQEMFGEKIADRRPEDGAYSPALNAYVGEDDMVVTAEIPGVNPNCLDIQVEGDTLTLKSERSEEALPEGQRWLRRERGSGAFTRHVRLAFRVDPDQAVAQVKNGVLTLTLPRAAADKPRRVAIQGGSR